MGIIIPKVGQTATITYSSTLGYKGEVEFRGIVAAVLEPYQTYPQELIDTYYGHKDHKLDHRRSSVWRLILSKPNGAFTVCPFDLDWEVTIRATGEASV